MNKKLLKTWCMLCLLMTGFNPAWAFTVSFNAGSGTCEFESLSETSQGSGIVLPEAVCSDPIWSFAGWSECEVAVTAKLPKLIAAGTTYIPTADMQLYAVYRLQEGEIGTYRRATSMQDVTSANSVVVVSTGYTLLHTLGKRAVPNEKNGTITPTSDTIFDLDGNNNDGFTLSFTNSEGVKYIGANDLPTKNGGGKLLTSESNNRWIVEQNGNDGSLFYLRNANSDYVIIRLDLGAWITYYSIYYSTYSTYALSLYVPNFSVTYATHTSTESSFPDVGYATFFDRQHAIQLPDGVNGYVAFTDAEGFHFTQQYNAGEIVPKGVAVVLKGTGNADLSYTIGGTAPSLNALRGAAQDMTAAEMDAAESDPCYFYALSLDKDGHNVGFYWMNEEGSAFDIPAGKAYLVLPQSTNARSGFTFGEGPEWINLPKNDQDEIVTYNVNGQRETDETKGLVIREGKKVIIK